MMREIIVIIHLLLPAGSLGVAPACVSAGHWGGGVYGQCRREFTT